jgi:hypothetical protein
MAKFKVHKVVIFKEYLGFGTLTNNDVIYNWPCSINSLLLCSLWNIYVVVLSIISIFIFSISLTPFEISLMALTIAKEPAFNFLLLFSILLSNFPYTTSNLQTLAIYKP